LNEPGAATARSATRRPAWRVAAPWLAGLLLALALPVAALVALLRSETGTAWLLGQVPGLALEGLQGSLLGPGLAVDRLRWQGSAGQLEIEALSLRAPHWRPWPAPGQWLGLAADGLQARRVRWVSTPSTEPTPMAAPPSLALPVQLDTPVQVGRLEIDGLGPIEGLAFRLTLGADGGAAHLLEGLRGQVAALRVQDGRLRIATAGPLDLDAQLALQSADGAALPWQAHIRTGGPLSALRLDAELRSGDRAAVDLSAALRPFDPRPLASARLRTDGLDLSAIDAALPQTRLQGELLLADAPAAAASGAASAGGASLPVTLKADLRNAAPGPWDGHRLPVASLQLQARGALDAPQRIDIGQFALVLHDGQQDAGRLEGSGRWQDHRLTLDLLLAALQPRRLDARAPAMTLGGPVSLAVDGLPSPDPAAAAPPGPLAVDLQGRLSGRGAPAPEDVAVELQAHWQPDHISLQKTQARAGSARASLSLDARRGDDGRWAVRSDGELTDFAPTRWWQALQTAGAQAGDRLNGRWHADLRGPVPAGSADWSTVLPRWEGEARLEVGDSTLAGLPVSADLRLARAGSAPATAAGRLTAGGNSATLDGQADATGSGAADRWTLQVDAPALAALAPLMRRLPALADWAPQDGQLQGRVEVQGRWPTLRSQGEARLSRLQAGELAIASARARWDLDLAAGGTPWAIDLQAQGLRYRAQQADSVLAQLEGRPEAHRWTVRAATPLQPPPALVQGLGATAADGTRLALEGEGRWQPAGGGGGQWTGEIRNLAVAAWTGEPPPAAGDRTAGDWLHAPRLRATVDIGPGGRLLRLQTDAGQATLVGGIALDWDTIVYDAATGFLDARARIAPFQVAPLLQRWQPDLGWQGNLQVQASVELSARERFDADIVIERSAGDLQVRDAAGAVMPLGLTDLRLGLSAHDGAWYFTQALAGKTLGELGGLLQVHSAPTRRWPAPEDPLSGSVQLRVASLGVWGAWVPPGWRLEGEVQTIARVGGRFGAPKLDGELRGTRLGARNLLEGLHVRDGELDLRLDGDQATIRQFTLRAGEGQLDVTGGGTLGEAPSMKLHLAARKFQVLGRVDRRLIASGDADLTLDGKALTASGQFDVDEGLFDVSRSDAPSLDGDVVVVRPGDRRNARPGGGEEDAKFATDLALTINLGDQIRVRGRGLDTRLDGRLRVTMPGGHLAVRGAVRTVGGTYAAYGEKLEIERGRIVFVGEPDNPRLDVLALRPDMDVEVGVLITGTAQSPRVRLHSNPEMSDTDKLSWLVLGRDPDSLGRTDMALLQRAAVALLAGQGEGPGDALARNLGLDTLSLSQTEGDNPDTVITLGRQLSQRWYVGYERGVNATAGTWQLIYRAAKRFTLRLQSGLDESLDAIWIWRVK